MISHFSYILQVFSGVKQAPLKELVIGCFTRLIIFSSILQTMSLSSLTKLVVSWDALQWQLSGKTKEFSQIVTHLPPTIVDLVILLGPGLVFFSLDAFVGCSKIRDLAHYT